MNLSSLQRNLTDLLRVNKRYFSDDRYRSDLRARLRPAAPSGEANARGSIGQREFDHAPEGSRPYRELAETSLALAGIATTATSPTLNLVVNEVRDGKAFAGVQTAVAVAVQLAERLGVPLRVVMTSWTVPGVSEAGAAAVVRERFGTVVQDVVARERILDTAFTPDDFWLATHWKTAHAVDVAARGGAVQRDRVVYLVQDYEPGFSPWSTEFAIARSTYQAGFELLVNSAPLRHHLEREEGLTIADDRTFAPHLDLDLLQRVAAARAKSDDVTVFFYGRPSKHRNLYRLGVAALKVAAAELGPDNRVRFTSAGEKHRNVDLGHGHKLESLGSLPWDDYFEFIASANVVLSLQHSPHPSHPPFDAAISGARAITNEFYDTRADLHPMLTAVAADPESLGSALAEAIRTARTEGPNGYLDVEPGKLGGSLSEAVESVAATLETVR
ncbi:hypothetical protein GCM10017714_11950 [Curtobacterium pusillum]|uniref:Glycosyltransferase n=1 Tax=Curtobacterium pusillum TaxID=69373 RepID=A0ABX2MDV3_9MICO|nr:glycosyltransferase [Curtobacterium pusillum]NUU13871.1 glycosyltransferase [Curtobacterium pusillum]GLK30455.1 hypothetical protein GCM10017610_07400 [Curtobacterium pusillum]